MKNLHIKLDVFSMRKDIMPVFESIEIQLTGMKYYQGKIHNNNMTH